MPGLDLADGRPGAATDGTLDDRVRAAALRCIARTGVRKTTLDDIAGEAGCSRATVYRAFPGGKDVLLASVADHEVARLLAALGAELDRCDTFDETVVVAISHAARAMAQHEALHYLVAYEPEVVLPHLSFEGLGPLLARAVEFLAPYLERFVDAEVAAATSEWAARVVVLYGEPEAPFDLTRPADARRLVTTYLMPGLVPGISQPETESQP